MATNPNYDRTTARGKAQLKADVEQLARENNLTVLETITFIQSAAAAGHLDDLLQALIELKRDYIPGYYD